MSATTEIAEKPKAAAVVRYEPNRAIGNVGTLKGLLEMQMGSIAQVLPKHITADKLAKTLFLAVNRTPKLLQCTQASVLESVMRAAELGLEVSGTLGDAYLVPFKTKIKIDGRDEWRDVCQLIPGYRGLIKLARNSGELRAIEAEVVRTGDHFVYEKGSAPRIEFRPKLDGDAGEMMGVYALAVLKSGETQAVYLSKREVEKVKASSKSGAFGPWVDWFEEMAKKTAIRRLAKLLPLESERWARALEAANAEFDMDALSAGAGAMVTAEMLGVDLPEPKAIEATARVVEPIERISPEAIARIRAAAIEAGVLPLELEDLVSKALAGLSLEDAEPSHEPVIMAAIGERGKPQSIPGAADIPRGRK